MPHCYSRPLWSGDMPDSGARDARIKLNPTSASEIYHNDLRYTDFGIGCRPLMWCQADSVFHPPWDSKMSIGFRAE